MENYDVVIVIGANDVVNPAAKEMKGSPIYGMPILNVDKAKNILILASTLITAAAVSFSGIIGFVGLIAPHTARLLWGGDYRTLIPLSSTLGATFLVISDLIARTIISPGELPVGIITALFGAPFFLYLLSFRRRETI